MFTRCELYRSPAFTVGDWLSPVSGAILASDSGLPALRMRSQVIVVDGYRNLLVAVGCLLGRSKE